MTTSHAPASAPLADHVSDRFTRRATMRAAVFVAPGRIDAGSFTGPFTLTAEQVGSGTLPNVTAAPSGASAAWISVAAPAAPSGLGAWTVSITRGSLADGNYAGAVTFNYGAGKTLDVPVTMRVGTAAAAGDAGYLYVLVVDPAAANPADAVKGQWNGRGTSGTYAFSVSGIPDGRYALVAGTDLDNDDFICDAGEACGAWPTLGVVTPVDVAGDMTGLDFGVGFDVGVAGLSTGARPGAEGFRRPAPAKAFGGWR